MRERGFLQLVRPRRNGAGAVGAEELLDVGCRVDIVGSLRDEDGGSGELDWDLGLQGRVGAHGELEEADAGLLLLLELAQQRGHVLRVKVLLPLVGALQLLAVLLVCLHRRIQGLLGLGLGLAHQLRFPSGIPFGPQISRRQRIRLLRSGQIRCFSALQKRDRLEVILGELVPLGAEKVLLPLKLLGEDADGGDELVDEAGGEVLVLAGAGVDLAQHALPALLVGTDFLREALGPVLALGELEEVLGKLFLDAGKLLEED